MARPTAAERIEKTRRTQRAVEMRVMGATYQQIADELGYKSAGSANTSVRRAMQDSLREPCDQLRELENLRLDKALDAIQGGLTHAKIPIRLKTVDRVVRLTRERMRLNGLAVQITEAPEEMGQLRITVQHEFGLALKGAALPPEMQTAIAAEQRELLPAHTAGPVIDAGPAADVL